MIKKDKSIDSQKEDYLFEEFFSERIRNLLSTE